MSDRPSSHGFAVLASARTLSVLGDGVTVVALMIYVTRAQMGGVAMGLVLLADIAPSLFSPVAGVFADRYGQRGLLVACELGQGVILGAMATALPPFPVLLASTFARS